jgi:hypothetical protein
VRRAGHGDAVTIGDARDGAAKVSRQIPMMGVGPRLDVARKIAAWAGRALGQGA